jgi:hypothetical protein
MNYTAIAAQLNQATDPLVALEIASTWSRREIEKAIAECQELAKEGCKVDADAALERLAILELCSPEFVAGCKKHWDKLDAMLNAA